MSRISTGPKVKERTRWLLEALLAFVDGELEDDKLNIDAKWQGTTSNLAVETRLISLELLTQKYNSSRKLTKDQIEESINRLKDFLKILEDKRFKTQGSPDWQFILKLWSTDKQKNLSQFDREWEKRKKSTPPDSPDSPDSPDNPPTNLPPERGIRDSTRFFGRDQTLEDLHQLLQTRGQVAICSVSGMGGLGKTELAIQYAKKYLHHYPKGIFWLDASGEMDIPTQIVNFTQETFDDFTVNRELPTQSQVRQCWKKWLASQLPAKCWRFLMIWQNMTELNSIYQTWRRCG